MRYILFLSLLLSVAALAPARGQGLTNNGAFLTLTGDVTLRVDGSLQNNSGTLDLGSGSSQVYVGGNMVNASGATLSAGTASTVLLNGTSAQQLNLKGAVLANLTVNNAGGGVAVSSDAGVAGALTLLSGMVSTDAFSVLRLLDGATVLGEQGSRYVRGNLAAVKGLVPAGTATSFPNGFTLTPPTALSSLTVYRRAGFLQAQTSYGTSANGLYKGIDQIWSTSAPVRGVMQLSWLPDNDNGLTDFGQSQIWARTAAPVAGSDWTLSSNRQDASSRTVTGTVPAGAAYSFFTVSTAAAPLGSVPLPVVLVSFAAQRAGAAAHLSWRTAQELHNDYFVVEVSPDGRAFRAVGEPVQGRGTGSTPTTYTFLDPHLLTYATDLVYYRLRQVDTDGTQTYSSVRTVRVEEGAGFAVAAFPTPHNEAGTRLQVRTARAGLLTLTAYDATGRRLFARSAELPAGVSALDLPEAGRLTTGVYYVQVLQAGQSAVLKLARE